MTRRSWPIISALSLALILGQVAIMAVPAVIVELAGEWSLDAAPIGWLGGVYFAGYAAGLPFLSGLAGRRDGRAAYVASAVIAAIASFAFAIEVSGFWSAMLLRFMAGVGFSGIHIVGLKLLADRLDGDNRARTGAFYSAAYALGSGASFLVAGLLSSAFGWPATFVAAGAAALLAIPLLLAIGPPLGQEAWEGVIAQTGDRHGVFTWVLLDAIRHGDTNNDGLIDLTELATHVQNRVAKVELRGPFGTTLSLAGRQSARLGSRGENFVLVGRLP
jgi:MFS family permease